MSGQKTITHAGMKCQSDLVIEHLYTQLADLRETLKRTEQERDGYVRKAIEHNSRMELLRELLKRGSSHGDLFIRNALAIDEVRDALGQSKRKRADGEP